MLLKLFLATVANADIGSLKSLDTFLTKCLYHMLVKFVWSKLHKILSFLTKKKKKKQFFKNHFWHSVDPILEDVSVAERII